MKDNIKIDFIGIGAAKCATTWAYKCLLEHPQICGPFVKELSYFITQPNPMSGKSFDHHKLLYNKGIESYIEKFKHCPKDSIKGEISGSYLSDPGSAELIKKYFPDVKILAFLRDPVKRAYSYYWFAKKFMIEETSQAFEEALKKPDSYELYVNRGMYYKHLKRYFDTFPRENIGVFFIDDLKISRVKFIQKIYEFLGADDNFLPPSINQRDNAAREVRSKFISKAINYLVNLFYAFIKFTRLFIIKDIVVKIGLQKFIYYFAYKINVKSFQKPPLNPETEKKLRRLFLEDINQLEKLVGRDLSSWK